MAVSKRLRFEILRRDGHRCRYCGAGALAAPLTVDHVTPLALGGTDDPSNLATACEPCNSGKTSTLPESGALALTELSATPLDLLQGAWGLLADHTPSELRAPATHSAHWLANIQGAWFYVRMDHGDSPTEDALAALKESIHSAAATFSGPVLFAAAHQAAHEASVDVARYALPLRNAVEAELRRVGQ